MTGMGAVAGSRREEFADSLQSVHFREHDEDQIRRVEAGGFECFRTVGSSDDFKACGFEIEGNQFDGIRLVVDHQDFWHDAHGGYHWKGRAFQRTDGYKPVTKS